MNKNKSSKKLVSIGIPNGVTNFGWVIGVDNWFG